MSVIPNDLCIHCAPHHSQVRRGFAFDVAHLSFATAAIHTPKVPTRFANAPHFQHAARNSQSRLSIRIGFAQITPCHGTQNRRELASEVKQLHRATARALRRTQRPQGVRKAKVHQTRTTHQKHASETAVRAFPANAGGSSASIRTSSCKQTLSRDRSIERFEAPWDQDCFNS